MMNRGFVQSIRRPEKVDERRRGVNLRAHFPPTAWTFPLLGGLVFAVVACSGVNSAVERTLANTAANRKRAANHQTKATNAQTGAANESANAARVVERWRRDLGRGLRGPVAASGGALILATADGAVHTISPDDGRRYWRRRPGGTFRYSALDAEGRVYAVTETGDGLAHALSARDGRRLWRRAVGPSGHAPAVGDGAVHIHGTRGEVVSLDAATGEERWQARLDTGPAAAPVIMGPSVHFFTRSDEVHRLDARDGTLINVTALPAAVSGPPLSLEGRLVIPLYSGEVLALDPRTGAVETLAEVGEPVLAQPTVDDAGGIWLLTRRGAVWRVDPRSRRSDRVAELRGAASGSLALSRDAVYVGMLDGTLITLGLDGAERWRFRLDDSIVAPAVPVDGGLIVPLLRGAVVRLETPP